MEQKGTPEGLQAEFAVLTELERKKPEGPKPFAGAAAAATSIFSIKDGWKKQQYQGSFTLYFGKVGPPGALPTLWKVLFMFPAAVDVYLLCLNSMSFLHVPTWPADREEILSNKTRCFAWEIPKQRYDLKLYIYLKIETVMAESSYLYYRGLKSSLIYIHYLYHAYIRLRTFFNPQEIFFFYATSIPWKAYWLGWIFNQTQFA